MMAVVDDLPQAVAAALRPSEYTAALIQVLRHRADWVRGADALEIGAGSGVVLAVLSALGSASVCGIEIEPVAIAAAADLLCDLDGPAMAELHQGDMWQPIGRRRFGLIAANLPHFPMPAQRFGERLPSWSSGGIDGRNLLDRFLLGLDTHLAPGGRAVITHNAFIDLPRSREIVAEFGLSLRVAMTVMVHIPSAKLELMTPAVLRAEEGRTIHRYGPYAFAEMHIVEIGDRAAFA